MIGIYKITNLINKKSYIGQSVHIERRWREHCMPSADSLIAKSIKKYGVENFNFEILEEVSDVNQLNEKESYYISLYNSIVPNGYNIVQEDDQHPSSFTFYNKEEFEQIVDYIQNSTLTFEEIAKKFNLNRRTITRINNGYVHQIQNISYPLRKTKPEKVNYYCIDCGIEISKGSKRCSSCARKASRFIERPTRQELKKLIREEPFTKIGAKFKVTDNTIRKWCDSYNLPKKKSEIKKYSDEEWESV